MNGLTRGALAKQCDIHPETIRFYERGGLLPEPDRSDSGYRLYQGDDVQRVLFIKRAQAVGFTLDQIRALLDLNYADQDATCGDVRGMVDEKITEIDEKIAHLTAMKRVLIRFQNDCPGGNESADICPILAAFAEIDRFQ